MFNRLSSFWLKTEKRSARPFTLTALQQAKTEWLQKALYFSTSSAWVEFYKKFHNHVGDKHWSSQECKTNMGYVLEGKCAEYFNNLIEWEPNLPYYDLIIRMEEFMQVQETSKPSTMTQYSHHVRRDFRNNIEVLLYPHSVMKIISLQIPSKCLSRTLHWRGPTVRNKKDISLTKVTKILAIQL